MFLYCKSCCTPIKKFFFFLQENNRLVYTVLGTDYHQYVVGYNCRTGHKRRKIVNKLFIISPLMLIFLTAEVVLQTRHKRVAHQYLEKAFTVIRTNDLPLNDMICQEGFGPPKKSKKKLPKNPISTGPAPTSPPSSPPPPPPPPPAPSPPPLPLSAPVSIKKSDKTDSSKIDFNSVKSSAPPPPAPVSIQQSDKTDSSKNDLNYEKSSAPPPPAPVSIQKSDKTDGSKNDLNSEKSSAKNPKNLSDSN